MNLRRVVLMSLVVCVVAAPVSAQEPGVDEDDCKGKDSKLLSRMPGCGLYECSAKDYDAADVVVSANPEWKLRVEGHTDNVGNPSANLKLSQARAAAVVSWLVSNGVDAGRLSATGLGDT